MTQETQETIKFARHWLEIADKHRDPNASTTGCMTALAKAVVELSAELDSLKNKTRWRKQSEEPAPDDDTLIICLLKKGGRCSWVAVIQARFIKQFEEPENNIFFWRPLDLPETEGQND